MKNRMFLVGLVAGVLSVAAAERIAAQEGNSGPSAPGAVFVMTNAAAKNEVISFSRNADGTLQEFRKFDTGGRGSGGVNDPLASQGSLTLSQDHRLLFAANAGSGEISVFMVHGPALQLVDRVSSGGSGPNSIAQIGNLVYVLNAGGGSNVTGFQLQGNHLRQIANSSRFLSTNEPGGGSVAFSPSGKFLAVTERLTNKNDIFPVEADGTLGSIVETDSAGAGAFASQFAPNGALVVSETGPAGVPNSSAISSYAVNGDGTLAVVSKSVPTLAAANCWNAITPDGRFVYTGNSASSNISGYEIGNDGTLTPLPGTIVGNLLAGAVNIDTAISADGKFLYTLNSGGGTVGMFGIQKVGTLVSLGVAGGLTASGGFQGIAAN